MDTPRTAEYGRRSLVLAACGYAGALLLAHYLLPLAWLPLAALLFFVWLPSIFMSVRNIWRSSNLKKTKK